MKDFLHKLFCKHEWNHYVYNIATHDYNSDKIPALITISFKDCKKCAKSKLEFIFGNE